MSNKTIKKIIEKYNLKGMTKFLCKCIGVSRFGYYNYLKNELKKQEKEIKEYINYYNKKRYQWNLKKMTPVMYRNHLLNKVP